ncbi:sigma-54-dependent Fis family transcriptional regulator [Amycolatopsis sp. GM8]|uniref:sigma-54-dependent Fis family transcriptional regulator n=1 Tax=Amycolatopsis sp. GM8 TaxID=2896530 RepID=UPI001F2C753B|nr:helix-turn-helix domain-containing protein [Amycolatopsis sp. GM8]
MARAATQQRAIELARRRFLAGENADGSVRDTILRSWTRCVAAGVNPTGPMELPHRGAVDPDSALLRAVRSVVEPIFAEMRTDAVAVLVSDAQGRLLGRWASARRLLGALDSVAAAPGYDCGEQLAGTTALGTVLEEQHPVAVRGAEHFSEVYRELSAFGAPIIHPVSGTLEGAIDFVSSTNEASELMMPLAIRAAGEIGTHLLSGYAAADRALLDGYLRADRRGYRRPIIAVNDRVLIANPLATDLLAGVDRQLLQEKIERAMADGRRKVVLCDGEPPVYATIQKIETADSVAGAVVQLRKAEDEPSRRSPRPAESRMSATLPGKSVVWRRFVQEAAHAAESRQHTLLVGESGSGKLTSARRLCSVANGNPPPALDVAEAIRRSPRSWLTELAERASNGSAPLVLTHLDRVDERALAALCSYLDDLRDPAWIIGTFGIDARRPSAPASLTARFPHVLQVPPLRDRPEDIPELVDTIAAAGNRRVDEAVKRTLSSFDWPGNIRQLERIVKAACRAGGGAPVRLDDLPLQFRTPKHRRTLSRLEQAERDAVIAALQATNGNKKAAAADLGISRATLYRRLVVLDLV